ncbi:MAG: HPr family phosphocarrier protein [Spirochaetaceae bacterium]|jgi:phosphotransferase system HPr (HPr) family protein|nr:HPr family phosphocarrier protein [Spirochaetaceae bacterium]
MHEISYTIADPDGIHARPAGKFVEEMQKFKSVITVNRDDKSADAKKLFALMKMRVKAGETIIVKAEGDDEEAAVNAALAFLKEHL